MEATETCGGCKNYRRAARCCEVTPQYGRCSVHTMVDSIQGKSNEDTRRPAIRFATDGCSDYRA